MILLPAFPVQDVNKFINKTNSSMEDIIVFIVPQR
jgi:hypothetical protein